MGMAVHSELGDAGFDLWNEWSKSAESYSERSAKDAWRSFKPGGAVGIGTLFYEAKQRGFKLNGAAKTVDAGEWERLRLERESRRRVAAEKEQRAAEAAAALAREIYDAAAPAR